MAHYQHDLIHAIILDKILNTLEKANAAKWSERSIKAMRLVLAFSE